MVYDEDEENVDRLIKSGKGLCDSFFRRVDSIEGDASEKTTIVMSAIGQILGASYTKVVDDFGPEAADDWLERMFKIAQILAVTSGKNIQFSFLKKD